MSLDYTEWENAVLQRAGECTGAENWCTAHDSAWTREVCQYVHGVLDLGRDPNHLIARCEGLLKAEQRAAFAVGETWEPWQVEVLWYHHPCEGAGRWCDTHESLRPRRGRLCFVMVDHMDCAYSAVLADRKAREETP
jgi:hypothetical protein